MTSTKTAESRSKRSYLPRTREKVQVQGLSVPGMYLKPRDLLTLLKVGQYRELTATQIEVLLYNSAQFSRLTQGISPGAASYSSRSRSRLRLLYHRGLLDRFEEPSLLSEGRKPYSYRLTAQGLALLVEKELVEEGEIELETTSTPTSLFRSHLQQTNTMRIAVELACQSYDWELVRWIDEKSLKRQGGTEVTFRGEKGRIVRTRVIPDAIFTIHTGERDFNFCLELDRGTETMAYSIAREGQRDFKQKLLGYGAYFHSTRENPSLFEQQYGKGVRLLTVTSGSRRAEHLKKLCDELGFEKRYWFTSFKEIINPEALFNSPIWWVASLEELQSIFG